MKTYPPGLLLPSAQEIAKTYEDSPFYAKIKKGWYDLITNQKWFELPTIDEDLDGLVADAPPPQKNLSQSRLEKLKSTIDDFVYGQNTFVLVDANQFECFFYGISADDFMGYSSPQCLALRINEKTKEALFWTENYFLSRPGSKARVFFGVYTIESIFKEVNNQWKKTSRGFRQDIDQYKNEPIYAELFTENQKYYSATLSLLQNLRSHFCTVPDSQLYQKLKEMAGYMKDESNNSNNGWDADGELIAAKLGLEISGQGPATILTADKKLQEREKALIAVLKNSGKEYFEKKFYEQLLNKTSQ